MKYLIATIIILFINLTKADIKSIPLNSQLTLEYNATELNELLNDFN
jgi:hypothetical protein